MDNYVIPIIGSSGYFELRQPLDVLSVVNERYTCKAIRKLSDYLANNEKPKKLIYLDNGLTEDEFKRDVLADLPIVSLQSDNGHWIHIPVSYVLSYPLVNGVPYRTVMIGISLPSLPVNKDIEHLETDLNNIIIDKLNVTPVIKTVETSRVVMVSEEKHQETQLARAILPKNKCTDSSKYATLVLAHAEAVRKIKILEDYITDNEFNNGTKIYKNKILNPADGSKNISSFVYFVSTDFKSRNILDIHVSSSWQVATDSGFTNIIAETVDDTINRTSWYIEDLVVSTVYYARVKYKGSATGYSIWGNTSSFTTKANFIPNIEKAKLSAGDVDTGDKFGYSISVDGSGKRVVIGAINASSPNAAHTGAAYVFLNTDNGWVQDAKLAPSDGGTGDMFGNSVSINKAGDVIVVGSYKHNGYSLFDTGAVYIYTRILGEWSSEVKLMAEDINNNNNYGCSTAIDSSGTRIAVGAYKRDYENIVNAGGVYVYVKVDDEWIQEDVIAASDCRDYDNFGISLAMNSDGTRIASGSRFKHSGTAKNVGAVYMFVRTANTWTEEAKLMANDNALFDLFGSSVSMDKTGTRVVVGAYLANSGTYRDAGAAYVFKRTGTLWEQETKLTSGVILYNGRFGNSVSMDDNGVRVVIGAYLADINGKTDTGAAHLFVREDTEWTRDSLLSASNLSPGDQFGWAVSIARDGDSIHIGAIRQDALGLSDSGSSYVFS